jgi:CubicO group peptidase (beta-lactamase class C family)
MVNFQRILEDRIDRDRNGIGLVVGIIDDRGSHVFAYGKMKAGETRQVDGNTLFEIGSITKTFTALVLQDMADHGELTLNDPVEKFLPAGVKTPSYHGRKITMVDLATHTSGLPRVPFGVWHMLTHMSDPYASFGELELYHYLGTCRLEREPGKTFEYSNLGLMLLGQALALKAGTNYEALVRGRICQPLHMESTAIELSPELQARFASGHNEAGEVVKNWSSPLPGDGGLRSSVNDMLKYLSAEMGLTDSPLSAAMAHTQAPRHETDGGNEKVGLGWIISTHKNADKDVAWHDGGTSGYMSWISFNKHTRRGVVVLSNSDNDVDDFGRMLMDILLGRRMYYEAAAVDSALYRPCVGRYECDTAKYGRMIFFITADHDKIYSRLKGQDAFEIFPLTATHYFNDDLNTGYIFGKDATGGGHQHGLHPGQQHLAVPPRQITLSGPSVSLPVALHRFEEPFIYAGSINLTTDGHRLLRLKIKRRRSLTESPERADDNSPGQSASPRARRPG